MLTCHSATVAASCLVLVSLVSDALAKEPDELRGTWKGVSRDANGKQMSVKEAPPMTLADGKVVSPDGKEAPMVTFAPDGKEIPFAMSYRTDSTKVPKELDFVYTTGVTLTMHGIYKIEKDQLTICFGIIGPGVDQKASSKRPADFAPGDGKLVQVFHREKEGDEARE